MKRVLVTRPRAQAQSFAEGLIAAGFEPIFFPVIEIGPMADDGELDRALERLAAYAWIVFTSVNAVELVCDRLRKNISLPRVAAVGPKTAEALRAHGVSPDFVPGDFVAEAILPGLGELANKLVLFPSAEIARNALPEAIAAAGGAAHVISIYRTLPAEPEAEGLAALRAGVDVITLTSPSTAHNFMTIVRQNGLDGLRLPGNPLFACIGPVTEQAAREEGLVHVAAASEHTGGGLIELIGEWSGNS